MRIILPEKSVKEFPCESIRIERLLETLGINPVGVLVVKNGKVVPEETLAEDRDEIRILRVAHGG